MAPSGPPLKQQSTEVVMNLFQQRGFILKKSASWRSNESSEKPSGRSKELDHRKFRMYLNTLPPRSMKTFPLLSLSTGIFQVNMALSIESRQRVRVSRVIVYIFPPTSSETGSCIELLLLSSAEWRLNILGCSSDICDRAELALVLISSSIED